VKSVNSKVEEKPDSPNFLLASLPPEVYDNLLPDLQAVQLIQGDILYDAGQSIDYVYFPVTCMLSWVVVTEDGNRSEVGVAGWEGMIGIAVVLEHNLLPYLIEVELPGEALKIRADRFKAAFDRSPATQHLILRYTHTTLVQLAQSAACNRFHSVEARLCRWLLGAHDRSTSDTLALTHETLAGMIGARRPAVSLVVGTLQRDGLIQAKRGEITIVDRSGLEAAACECYGIVKAEFARFLSTISP
jgi:CRP-like cAMP-binding protein